jgi:hypothetical protein
MVQTAESRSEAFEAFLARRQAEGYRIETRGHFQAVIVRRRRLSLLLRWFMHDLAPRRLVVSVDQDGDVTTVEAEPRRW